MEYPFKTNYFCLSVLNSVVALLTMKNKTLSLCLATDCIKPDRDKIKVGRGMCSGAFDFDGSTEGNLTVWTGKRIRFAKPTQQTSHEDEWKLHTKAV